MTKAKQAELLKVLKEYTKSVTETQEKAQKALVDEGIYLTNGELAPEYKDSVAA